MALHIGKLITQKIDEIGISKSEFGRRVSITPQKTQYILKKKSIDTDMLRKVSLALNYDFFQHYLGLHPEGKTNDRLVNVTAEQLKPQLSELRQEIETLKLHNSYLREIVNLLDPGKDRFTLEKNRQKKKKLQ